METRDGNERGEFPGMDAAKEIGQISYKALQKAKAMIKPGVKLIDVAESVESYVKESKYGIAFPLNLSINNEAAHYTPSIDDAKVFSEKDVVKVDFGAAKDGALGDCALTVDLSGNMQGLLEASEEALKAAISVAKAGVEVRDIGKEIEKAIIAKGYQPIRNLGGHTVGLHELHSSIFVPNYDNGDETVLEEGMLVAIEPFATTGKGMVTESDVCEIYSYDAGVQVRTKEARTLLGLIQKNHPTEPFAVRWLASALGSTFSTYAGISELSRNGALMPYPTLVEISGGSVSQAEAEVIIEKDGCEVVTK
jgi:methionyl aminopeptidase